MTEPEHPSEPPPESVKTPIRPDIWDILMVCWMVLSLVLASDRVFEPWAGKFKYILSELLQILVVGSYLYLRNYSLAEIFRWRKLPFSVWKYIIPLALGLAIGFDALDRAMNLIIPLPLEQMNKLLEALHADNFTQLGAIVLGIGIFAPWVEESIFRGMVQQGWEARRTPVQAVLGTAFLFALIHFQPWQLVQLLIFSVIIGYWAWLMDSIIPAFLIHSANNLFSLALINEGTSKWQRYYIWEGYIHPLWLLGSAVVIVWSWRKCMQLGMRNINTI